MPSRPPSSATSSAKIVARHFAPPNLLRKFPPVADDKSPAIGSSAARHAQGGFAPRVTDGQRAGWRSR